MATGYTVAASSSLSAATAKSALNIIAGSTRAPTLVEFGVSFDGVTPTATPVLVELCGSTQATAGTPGTSPTPRLIRGDSNETSLATAGINYTAEPTALVVLKSWLVSPMGGMVLQFPLGRETSGQCATASPRKGMVFRLTAPAAVNYNIYAEFEE